MVIGGLSTRKLSFILLNKQLSQLNIPKRIRDSINAKFDQKKMFLSAAGSVQELYDGAKKETLNTRKGSWIKYTQTDYKKPSFANLEDEDPQNRFCAVYYRDKTPLTIIRGDTSDTKRIDHLLKTISKKIIEQIPFISSPKKSLTEEKGLSYGIRIGFIFSLFLVIFIIFDYALIPDHPEAILQGASIITESDVNSYSPDSKIFQYRSVTRRLIEHVVPAEYRDLLSSMYSLFIFFILPILIFGLFYEISGKKADRRRMKALPAEALNYQYGFEAANAIIEESSSRRNELIKKEIYSQLSLYGMKIDEADFKNILSNILDIK